MIGREEVSVRVRNLLDRAAAGTSTVQIIVGEPGAGKTEVCSYAAGVAASMGMSVFSIVGTSGEAEFEGAGLTQLLRPLSHAPVSLDARQRQVIDAALNVDQTVLGDVFSLSVVTLASIAAAADQRGLLLVVDDSHWLDDLTLRVLAFVIRRLTADPVGILIAQRPVPIARLRGIAETYPLPALTASATAELISHARPDLPALPAAMSDALANQLGGNPLIISEYAARLTAEQVAGADQLPDPLLLGTQGAISFEPQLAGLPMMTRRAIAVVAVAGSQRNLIRTALADCGLSVANLDAAIDARVLVPDGTNFTHPLRRSAAYSGVSAAFRRSVHAALARLNAGRDLERYAFHLDASGADRRVVADAMAAAARSVTRNVGGGAAASLWARAAELTDGPVTRQRRTILAAQAAREAGDAAAAHRLLDTILRSDRRQLPDSVRVDALVLRCQLAVWHSTDHAAAAQLFADLDDIQRADGVHAVEVSLDVAYAMQNRGMLSEAARITERAVELAAGMSDARRVLTACAYAQCHTLARGARNAPAIDEIIDLEMAERFAGDKTFAIRAVAQTAEWQEKFDFGMQVSAAAIARMRRLNSLAWLPYTLTVYASLLWWSGSGPRARATMAEGIQLAEDIGQDGLLLFGLGNAARIAAGMGLDSEADTLGQVALDRASEAALRPAALYAHHALGLAALYRRHADAAVEHLEQAHVIATETGMVQPVVVPYIGDLAEAHILAGHHSRATVIADLIDQVAERSGSRWAAATSLRTRGLLDLTAETSGDLLRRSISTLRSPLDMPFDRARSTMALGEHLRRRRELSAARDVLRDAAAGFRNIGSPGWAERANKELRAAGDRTPHQAAPGEALASLSPQQLQVALAAADGATNRQIAAALFLSPKTVDYHLRRAYNTLGVRNRVELAAVVSRSTPAAQ